MAGSEVRKVEGKISERFASLGPLKMSPLGIHRNYEQALKALGAVRVDTVYPGNEDFINRHGGDKDALFQKLRIMNLQKSDEADTPGFEQYLLRTQTTNIWIAFHLFDDDRNVCVEVIEEKALEQSVKPIAAAEMATALQKDGHIALYLNFDTDSHVIRPDSTPVVEQIVTLLREDLALKLKVEGHTDAVGDAAHNKQLSLARARAVVDAVAAQKIAAARLSAAGLGSERPIAANSTDEGRAKNRRVELVRI
ncbi:MAG: OmpA family protein [Massilia sp.]